MTLLATMIKKLDRKLGRSRRKAVPRVERLSSLVILMLILGVGVAIAVKGRLYDPGRYELDEAALATTAGPGADVTASLQAPDGEANGEVEAYAEGHGGDTVDSGASASRKPLTVAVAGMRPAGKTEFYNPDNLYEKIDGRADAYLAFDFVQLRSRSFDLTGSGAKAAGGAFIDIYVYEMGEPLNAYGIYALERDPQGSGLGFGEDSYRSGMGLFLRQGDVYLQVLASDESEATLAVAEAVAREFVGSIDADSAGLEGRLRLPVAGQVPGTVGFELRNAQGQSFLSNVFSADYTAEGATLRFFIAVQPDEAAAESVFAQYREFCEMFGEVAVEESGDAQILKAEMFGTWKIIYWRGVEVGGVIDTETPDIAHRFIDGLLAEK